MKAGKESETRAASRTEKCVFDGTQLKDWNERSNDLYMRSSALCGKCCAIYVSNLNTVSQEIKNYVRRVGAGEWKCIDCNQELQKTTLKQDARQIFGLIRLTPATPTEIMQCPGCGTQSTDKIEPLLMLR